MENISQQSAINQPLQKRIYSSIKKVGDTMFELFSSVVQAVPGEIRAIKRHFSKNPAIQSVVRLFQKKAAIPEKKETPPNEGISLLEDRVAKIDNLSLEQKNKVSLSKKYLSRSELKKESSEWEVSKEDLSLLFDSASVSEKSQMMKLLTFLEKFFIQQKKPFPIDKNILDAFDSAFENELKELLPNIRNMSPKEQAKELLQSVAGLSTDKPLIYFGPLSNSVIRKKSFLDKTLQKTLPEPIYHWVASDKEQLAQVIRTFFLKEFEKSGLNVEHIQNFGDKIENSAKRILEKSANGLESVLPPSWYEGMILSLKEDLYELAFNNVEKEKFHQHLEFVWNKIKEGGLRKALEEQLEKTFLSLLEDGKLKTDAILNDLFRNISKDLPEEALRSLSLAGIEIDIRSNFWIEIRKQSNGKYSLHFFSNDSSGTIHEPMLRDRGEGRLLPLVFSDIPLEALNEDFFQRLLSFRSWQITEGIDYTLQDVKEGLLDVCLGSYRDEPKETNVSPWKNGLRNDLFDWIKVYIHHHSSDRKCDFQKLFEFDLPYQTLIHFWPEVVKNPELLKSPEFRRKIRGLVNRISDSAVRFFEEKKLSADELRSIYATVHEAQKAISKPVPSKQVFAPSAIIPQELQAQVKELMHKIGCTPNNIEIFKSALSSLLGEEVDEALNLLFEDLIPKGDETTEVLKEKKASWEEIFGLNKVEDLIKTVRSMRFSLLHIGRICGKVVTLVGMYLQAAVGAGLIEAVLRIFFPHIALYTTLSFRIIARLLSLYGPAILKKILPEDAYKPLAAFFGFFSEISSYIKTRVTLLVTRFLLSRLLGSEQWTHIKNSVHGIQSDLTRKGKLSFEPTPGIPFIEQKQDPILLEVENPGLIEQNRKFISDFRIKSDFRIREVLPLPFTLRIKPNEIQNILKNWIEQVEILKEKGNNYVLPFLNAQLRFLPIPNSEAGKLFWQKIDAPEEVLELLLKLALSLKDAQNIKVSLEEHAESVVSLFSLYAISDTLARKCPETYLSDQYLANGLQLVYFLGSPTFNVFDPRSYETFLDVAEYFGFEREFRPYTEEEIENYRNQKGRLFNYAAFDNLSKSLGHRQASFRWTADHDYFDSLLKSSSEVRQRLKCIKEKNEKFEFHNMFIMLLNPKLDQEGKERLLPRPFHVLRFMDILCRNIDSRPDIFPKDEELEFSLSQNKFEDHFSVFIRKWIETPLNRLTKNFFKFGGLSANYKLSPEIRNNDQDTLPKREYIEYSEWQPTRNPLFQQQDRTTLIIQNRTLWNKFETPTQSEIMLDEPRKGLCGKVKPEVNRIFQMLRMHRSDQIVRCFALFEDQPQRFKDPIWRSLFDTIVNEVGAIDEQLKMHPKIIKSWGAFFHNQFKNLKSQSDLAAILFLSQTANDLLAHCLRYDKNAHSYFPNFSNELEKLRPRIQKGEFAPIYNPRNAEFNLGFSNLALCDLHQVLCYRHLDPNKTSEKEQKEAIFHLSRYFLSISKEHQSRGCDLQSICAKIFYKWHPFIFDAINNDEQQRNAILNAIVIDAGNNPNNFDGEWTKGFLPGTFYKGNLDDNNFWIEPFEQRYSYSQNNKPQIIERIEIEPPLQEKVDVKRYFEKGLRLLRWFEPVSETKMQGRTKNGKAVLEEISFSRLDLHFKIEDIKGQKRAICVDGKTPGFYIAPTQLDPKLNVYSRYLLLENEEGKKKVHLPSESIEQIISSFLLKKMANLPSSPLIRNSLQNFLETISENKKNKKIFTYTLNGKGELESNDPEAIAHLVVFHLINNDMDVSLRYFSELERMGRLAPFSDSVRELMDALTLPLLISQDRKSEELLLRLEAIRSENTLIAHKGKIGFEQTENNVLRLVTVQLGYNSYLKKIQGGMNPYLDPEKELFILKSIALFSINIAKNQLENLIRSDEYISKLLRKIGVENLAEHLLMIPALSRRFHQLKKQIGEGSQWGKILSFCSSFLEESGQSPSFMISQKINERIDRLNFSKYSRKESLISRVLSVAKKSLATQELHIPEKKLTILAKIDDNFTFEFLDLTPANIERNFLSLYQIAFGVPPESLKSNPEEIQSFENKRKKLSIYLSMFKGKTRAPVVQALIAILTQVCDHKPLLDSPPTAKELEKLLKSNEKKNHLEFLKKLELILDGYKTRTYLKHVFKVFFGDSLKENVTNTTKFVAKKLFFSTIGAPLKFINRASRGWFAFRNCVPIGEDDLLGNISPKNIRFGSGVFSGLSETISRALEQREHAIDSVMDGLIETYFEPKKEDIQQKEEAKVAPYEFKNNEELNEVNFNDLNKSLEEYYQRPQQKKQSYVLKKEKTNEELLEDLSQLRRTVEQDYLLPERREMTKFVNYEFKEAANEDEQLIEKLRNRKKSKMDAISFEEIDRLFILHQENTLIQRTGMSVKHLEELRKRWYLYHLMSSRWNLLFDQIEKYKGDVHGIAGELSRRRAYGFSMDEKPERLIRSLLVFESQSKKMLWKDQCDQTVKLLMNRKNQKLLELIMAGGKSWFIIPTVSHYDTEGEDQLEPSKTEKKLMINVWPSSLAKANIEQSAKQGSEIYHQNTNRLDITRESNWEKSYGWALRNMFRRAFEKGEKIDTTKEDLQAFELNLLEQAFESNPPSEHKESILDDFVNIGGLIQSHGLFNTDELHEQRNPTKELNYPIGKKQTVSDPFVEVFEDGLYEIMACCKELEKSIAVILKKPELLSKQEYRNEFAHLLKNPKLSQIEQLNILEDFAEKLKIISQRSDTPKPIPENVYQEQILPILTRRIAMLPMFKLISKQRKFFEKYISGQSEKIPDCVALNENRAQMALAKGLLTVCLPQTLASHIHVDYHQSLQGNGEFARPSEGNMNPSEDSIIRNPYEALNKSAFLLLRNRLNEYQMHKLLSFLRDRAKNTAKLEMCHFGETPEAQFFNTHCPGHDLQYFERTFKQIHEKMNTSDRVVLTYFRHFVAKEITFYPENLSQNSSNYTSMCQEINGFTGTSYNKGCYPKDMEILSNTGTDGESIDFLEKNAEVIQLENEGPKNVLEELKRWFDRRPKGRMFVDVDAGLNGIETKDVMKSLLKHIEKRDDLDAVAGYIGSQKVIWQKGAPEPMPFDQIRIPPERRLTYYDNAHIFGADIDQMREAEMFLFYTEGPRFKLFQGLWRARGLKTLNQKAIILTTKKASLEITKTPNKIPTPREINVFAQKTEEAMLKKLNYASDRQEMHDVIRRAILIKAYETGTFQGFRTIVSRFPEVFKRKLETDPYQLFGQIDDWVSPENVFQQLRLKLSNIAKTTKLFSKNELKIIDQKLNQIGHGDYPKKVHVYKSDKGISENGLDDMNKSSTIKISEQNNVKNEEEEKIQLQNEEEVHQLELKPKKQRKPQTFFPWNPKLNPTQLNSWLYIGENQKGGVPIFSVKDELAKFDPLRKKVAEHLSPKILASNNIFHLKTKKSTPVKPFGKYQIPIFKALIVSHNNECPKIILVDQKESEDFWKKYLMMDREKKFLEQDPLVKIGLYDIHTKMLVAEGMNAFDEELQSPNFKEVMVQIKFLSGCVRYNNEEQTILKNWLKNDPESMIDYFRLVHKHHGTAPYEGSCIEVIYYEMTNKKEQYKLRCN